MLALPVVWAGRDRPAVTPPTSQMALLDRWLPAARPFGVELTPTRRLDQDGLIGRLALSTSLRGHRTPGVSPLLRIPEVPAGEFDVFVEGRSRLEGVATVRLGRDALPMETWRLDGRPSGFTGLTLRLPAIAHSISIVGDDAATASVRRLMLRPRTLPASEPSQPHALRAARYGATVVFAARRQRLLRGWGDLGAGRTDDADDRAGRRPGAGGRCDSPAGPWPTRSRWRRQAGRVRCALAPEERRDVRAAGRGARAGGAHGDERHRLPSVRARRRQRRRALAGRLPHLAVTPAPRPDQKRVGAAEVEALEGQRAGVVLRLVEDVDRCGSRPARRSSGAG